MGPRVLIVSDDPWAGAGLAASLAGEPGLRVLGPVGSGADFGPYRPEVLLWDLGAGPPDPPDLTDWGELDIPVVALLADGSRLARVLAAGARAALPRESDPERLCVAIEGVARGLVVLDPAFLAELLPDPQPDPPGPPADPLTERELEVLGLLAAGLSNKAVAGRLDISEHTAKFHVAQILAKLGAESRTEAVVRAAQMGLVLL